MNIINKIIFIMVLLLTLIIPFHVFAVKEFNIPPYKQLGANTCWAACCKMVLDAYKYPKTEMEIRKWAFPPNGSDVTNEFTGKPKSTDKVLENYGPIYSTFTDFNPSTGGGNIAQKDVVYEIDGGRPILAGRLNGDGTKHMLLIRGYMGAGGSVTGNISYNDPKTGTNEKLSYAVFVKSGTSYAWIETLRLKTNPKNPIGTGIGQNEYVTMLSGTAQITQSPQSLTFTAGKAGSHVPVRWNWKLIFPHEGGDCIAASWTVASTNVQSTWNILNFILPAGYTWKYNFDGKIPGRVEVVVEDNAGPPAHADASNVLYSPGSRYSGVIIYENKTVSNAQPEVKAHELIIAQNDQFLSGGNITFKSGARIDINTGIAINNGSITNFVIDPTIR